MRRMRQGLQCLVLLCLAAGSVLSGAAHAETVVWRKTPIAVELVVGVEQLLILPGNAEVGLPPALTNPNVFRTLVTGGAAYWTAVSSCYSTSAPAPSNNRLRPRTPCRWCWRGARPSWVSRA